MESSMIVRPGLAGVEGIEPPSKVLETSILPLNYTPCVLPGRIELPSEVPQTPILSVKLQELIPYILSSQKLKFTPGLRRLTDVREPGFDG